MKCGNVFIEGSRRHKELSEKKTSNMNSYFLTVPNHL